MNKRIRYVSMQYSSAACGRWPSFSPYEHTEQADCQGENEIEKKKPNKQKNNKKLFKLYENQNEIRNLM